jgi:hypothetical protein
LLVQTAVQIFETARKFDRQDLSQFVLQFAASHIEIMGSLHATDSSFLSLQAAVEEFRRSKLNLIPNYSVANFGDFINNTKWLRSWANAITAAPDLDGYVTEEEEEGEVSRLYAVHQHGSDAPQPSLLNSSLSLSLSSSSTSSRGSTSAMDIDRATSDASSRDKGPIISPFMSQQRINRASLPKFVSHSWTRIGGNKLVALGGGFRHSTSNRYDPHGMTIAYVYDTSK